MIRLAAAFAMLAALQGAAQARENEQPLAAGPYVRVFPAFLCALPLPMTPPTAARDLRDPA